MNNKEIIEIALLQSANDSNCFMEDFNRNENKVVLSVKNSKARKYIQPLVFQKFSRFGI